MEAPAEPRTFCHRYQTTRTAETTLCRELRRLGKPAQHIQHQNPRQGTARLCLRAVRVPTAAPARLFQRSGAPPEPAPRSRACAAPGSTFSFQTDLAALSSALHCQPSSPSFQRPSGSFCNYSHFLGKKKVPAIKTTDGTWSRSWQISGCQPGEQPHATALPNGMTGMPHHPTTAKLTVSATGYRGKNRGNACGTWTTGKPGDAETN